MIPLDILMPFVTATERAYRDQTGTPLRRCAIRPAADATTPALPAVIAGFGGAIRGCCALSLPQGDAAKHYTLLESLMRHAQTALASTRHRFEHSPAVLLEDAEAEMLHAPGAVAQSICFQTPDGEEIQITLILHPNPA